METLLRLHSTFSNLKALKINELKHPRSGVFYYEGSHTVTPGLSRGLRFCYELFVQYYAYILAKGYHSTLYMGVTNNLERRVHEHKLRLVEGHTKKYGIDRLVYYEVFNDINDAIRREKQLKRYPREYKYNLIERDNLYWDDLAKDWYKEYAP